MTGPATAGSLPGKADGAGKLYPAPSWGREDLKLRLRGRRCAYDFPPELGQSTGADRVTDPFQEAGGEAEVVLGGEGDRQQLVRLEEMVQVGAPVPGAGVAVAAL